MPLTTKKTALLAIVLLVVGAACNFVDTTGSVVNDRPGFEALHKEIADGDWGNIHAVIISRDGETLFEHYFAGADERLGRDLGLVSHNDRTLHDVRSISKTITATLVGIAIGQGHIEGADQRLIDLLPEYSSLLQDEKSEITLSHVLTMSAGLQWDEESIPYTDPQNDERRLSASSDPVRLVLARELISPPGHELLYSGGLTHILAEILHRATSVSIDSYAREMLFAPLGIENWEWMNSGSAKPSSFSGLRMRARDLVRFGSLFLNDGKWQRRQIVPSDWIDQALKTHIRFEDTTAPDYAITNGYSYQWWTSDFQTDRGVFPVFAAVGNGGQRVIVVPSTGLLVVILAGEYNEPDYSWTPEDLLVERILPLVEKTP